MVDLVGRGYVVQHCISLYRKKQENFVFQSYIADVLQSLNNAFAKQFGGTEITVRFADLVIPKEEKKEKERSGDEIAQDIILRAGLSFGVKEKSDG